MEGWLKYARNGRMAEYARKRKNGWSMAAGGMMAGVCQEMSGWRECVTGSERMVGVYQEMELWLRYAAGGWMTLVCR